MGKFNESNTIEQGLVDLLSSLKNQSWKYYHEDDLPRESHEVIIENWLKKSLCKLNPDINKDPDKADEVIYKLRGVLIEADNSGLVSANELFTEWLRGEKSMPLGENGEHITINLIDFS